MGQQFHENDDEYRKRLSREAAERTVENVTGSSPSQGIFEDEQEYRERISRESSEGVIKNSTGSDPSQHFLEDDSEYRDRISREATERSIKDSTGHAPSQGFLESDAEYRNRIAREATESAIERITGNSPSPGFLETEAEYLKRIEIEANEALLAQPKRGKPSDPDTPSSSDDSDFGEAMVGCFIKLGLWIGLAVLIIWLVLMAVAITVMLSPIWLGAIAVGVICGFFLAPRVSSRIPSEALSEARILREKKGKGTRYRLDHDFFKGRVRFMPDVLSLIGATLIFGIGMALQPFMGTEDEFTQMLLGASVLAGTIFGSMFGLRVLRLQLENSIIGRTNVADASNLVAPKVALGFSIPGLIVLAGFWILALSQSNGPLVISEKLGFGGSQPTVANSNGSANATQPSGFPPQTSPNSLSVSPVRSMDPHGTTERYSGPKTIESSNVIQSNDLFPQITQQPLPTTLGSSGASVPALDGAGGVQQFIFLRVQTEQSHNLDRIMNQYADRVIYWDSGSVDKDFIRRDKADYFTRWPETSEEIVGLVEVTQDGADWSARYRTNFKVVNTVKAMSFHGTQESTVKIRIANGQFKIISDIGRVLQKERGQLAPSAVPGVQKDLAFSDRFPGERYPETRTRQLFVGDVSGLSQDRIRYAINEMFARHGADFPKPEIKKHFQQFQWYHPRPKLDFDQIEAEFSDLEKANVKVLGAVRDSKTNRNSPGR